jgi:DUF1680 family protein
MRNHTPVNYAAVRIDGSFWRDWLETVAGKTVPEQFRRFEAGGLIAALTGGEAEADSTEPSITDAKYRDAEIGKWLEAAIAATAFERNAETDARIAALAEALAKAQMTDGYLNTWFSHNAADKRWSNLRDDRELYAAGHLIEAAVADFQTTGERRLIDIAIKLADHIAATFGRSEDQRRGYCGYPEIELALLRLYSVSKDERHRDLAAYFIDERGRQPHYFDLEAVARGDEPADLVGRTYEYTQSHRRVRTQETVIGNVSRALNLYAAMAQLAAEMGDHSLERTVETLWRDVTTHHLYVTGGVGPDRESGAFGPNFALPNATAAATTSAAVGMVNWAKRMLTASLDGAVADIMELSLYNAALAGLAQDGLSYFHFNPLESDGGEQRLDWQDDTSAATDIARLIGSVGGLFYSTRDDCLAVHLYGGASATVSLGGRAVSIREASKYPWSGRIKLLIEPEAPHEFTLRLRIPGYAAGAKARINDAGVDVGDNLVTGYLELRRRWQPGDLVELDLPMPIERVYAHPAVAADAGRVALKRGPLVYCFEAADNRAVPLSSAVLPRNAAITVEEQPGLFGGVMTLVAEGLVNEAGTWGTALYRNEPMKTRAAALVAVPYYLWGNRGADAMRVWLPED